MFDPALAGYWGSADVDAAMATALGVIAANPGKVDGIKISLLDKDKEIAMRRRLPEGVRMYTGDDFNYAELIAGDAVGHSDALLGIFDAIAPAASAALSALAAGDRAPQRPAVQQPSQQVEQHGIVAPVHVSRSRQPRSSTASMMRSMWFHQMTGGMSNAACHTGVAICNSTAQR